MEYNEYVSIIRYEAYLICKNNYTVRQVAKAVGRSKSTVFLDMKKRLKNIDLSLSENVEKVFEEHKKIRHILGGNATKNKYANLKN